MLEARINKQSKVPLKKPEVPKKQDDLDFLPPPPPPIFHSTKILDNYNSCDDLPLPPPPSQLKIPASILTPPLSSDENDLPQKPVDKVHNNANGNGEKVNYRNKKNHSNGHNNQSSDSHNASSRFSLNKPELSTHARDRRSYIEKNNNEMFANGGLEEALDVTKIADGIANGQHPVCDKCKCKITRYV